VCFANLSHGGLVHEPHFTLPQPQRGVVGVDSLLEAFFGRDGGDHGMRIAGRKSAVRGGVIGQNDGDAGHPLNGAHFSEHVFVKPWRDA